MYSKLQLQSSKPVKGFTLIELLVSIAVISILLGITYAGYAGLDQRQKLIAAGQNMKNILRDAQSRSYTGEVDCTYCYCPSNTSNPVLSGWYVDFTDRKIYGSCGEATFTDVAFNLATDVVITPFITPAAPVAKLLYRKYPSGVDQAATICLSRNDLSDSFYKISVNTAGTVSDSGGIVSVCTP